MTTKFMNTKGIQLFKVNGEVYCKMIDVIRLIHHEFFETQNKETKEVLDRMEMRVAKNDFILPTAEKPMVISEKKQHNRYGVGYYDKNGEYSFYVGTVEGKDIYSNKPCKAKLFEKYRDASAVADFLDEDACVLDFEGIRSEEERWQRDLVIPHDADEGNIDSIPIEAIT